MATLKLLTLFIVKLVVLYGIVAVPFCTAGASEILPQVLFTEPNAHVELLGRLSEDPDMLVRTYMSQPHKDAAQQIRKWMEDAGMVSWVDVIGNVHGYINASDPEAPALMMGSHYDTIVDAGKYDGNLGIIVAIAAVKAMGVRHMEAQGASVQAAAGREAVVPQGTLTPALKHPLHIVAFCDEEGVRFKTTFLGSRAIAGTHGQHGVLFARDEANASVIEVLRSNGVADPERAVGQLAIPPVHVKHYIEVHIEQGPVLEREGQPLGVVSAILGQNWLLVHVGGEQGHAGTVPMRGRRDALAASAEIVTMIERKCGGGPYEDVDRVARLRIAEGERLVCTVGTFSIHPGATNVIPGAVNFTVDVRSRGEPARRRVVYDIQRSIIAICKLRGVDCKVLPIHSARGAEADPEIVADLHTAIVDSRPLFQQLLAQLPAEVGAAERTSEDTMCSIGEDSESEEQCSGGGGSVDVPVMVSGAGHDALAISDIANFGMMFVRCLGGISHSPLEYVKPTDVAAATTALMVYLEREAM